MKGAYKKFDKSLYQKNDQDAKDLTIKRLTNEWKGQGVSFLENPDRYGVDLWMMRNQEIIAYVECEIKMVWKTYDFPYNTIQFPERKAKFANLGKPTLFCMINDSRDRMLTIWGKDLITSPIKEVPNKYKKTGELFFQVPKSKAVFYETKC